MRVLGIETSCDETGIAIYCSEQQLMANVLHSQIDTHRDFGGVVPELASRDHIAYLIPLVRQALQQAQLRLEDIDGIAYTQGPGLIGALLVGASFAKSLAFGLNKPVLGVHHLEAHLLAPFLESSDLSFPFVALLVSGGHTQLIEAQHLGHYQLLGETLDDAVGEAFDKTAKCMGIPYPGGPKLAVLADSYTSTSILAPFPRPMLDRPGLDFSFSGLKTHALLTWQKSDKTIQDQQAIAHAFQQAVVDTLVTKCKRAIQQTQHKRLVVAGGVGANQALRRALMELMIRSQGKAYFPDLAYCTDNGAMVAYTGCQYLMQDIKDEDWAVKAKSRWPL